MYEEAKALVAEHLRLEVEIAEIDLELYKIKMGEIKWVIKLNQTSTTAI